MRKTTNTTTNETEFKLSPRAEAFNLAAHGTQAVKLTARNLVQAAESDLRAYARNKNPKRPNDEPLESYAFGDAAVASSKSAADVLRKAIEFRASILCLGQTDEKKRKAAWRKLPLSTFRVYQDEGTLKEAADLASAAEQQVAA